MLRITQFRRTFFKTIITHQPIQQFAKQPYFNDGDVVSGCDVMPHDYQKKKGSKDKIDGYEEDVVIAQECIIINMTEHNKTIRTPDDEFDDFYDFYDDE